MDESYISVHHVTQFNMGIAESVEIERNPSLSR